jgi:hypothetical protein
MLNFLKWVVGRATLYNARVWNYYFFEIATLRFASFAMTAGLEFERVEIFMGICTISFLDDTPLAPLERGMMEVWHGICSMCDTNDIVRNHFNLKKMETLINKPLPKYDCTQAELYAICTLGWNSCSDHLIDFTNLKPYYTAAYVTAKKAAIAAAKALPHETARAGEIKNARVLLAEKGGECLVKWQALKRHIEDAFAKNQLDGMLDQAGQVYYATAKRENWEDLELLMISGSTFIDDNSAALLANDNMPVGFEAEFDGLKDEYSALYESFKGLEQGAKELTIAKINANNVLFEELMKMFRDGVHIFRVNEAIRERFVWKVVKELVSSSTGNPNEVTLSGILTDNVTNEPIAGAQFVVGPYSFETEGDGSFLQKFEISEPTTYDVTITAEGYVTESTIYQFTPGVDINQNVQMSPEAPAATGTMSGTVTDAGTLMGIGGAMITATKGTTTVAVNADAMGNFSMGGLPVGTYTVTVNAAGYVGQSVSVTINANVNTVQNFSLVVMP